jgi:hypothetical protein
MKSKKPSENLPIEEIGFTYSVAPKTHVFYEYQGERAVDPLLMVENGISLWHEQMLNIPERDVSHLWGYAEKLLASSYDAHLYSYIEWLRYEITTGVIVPEKWDRKRPYPYKWMLISAIYFQEARRLCEAGNADRVWHIVAMAYYQLGLNTSSSLTQAVAKAAKTRHSDTSICKRAFVLAALDKIKRDGIAKSIPQAIDEVHNLIAASKEATEMLDEIEAQASKEAKQADEAQAPKEAKQADADDAVERLRGTLKNWARADGPYPEMSEAFSYFDKTKTQPNFRPTDENIPRDKLPDDCTHYMRFVSYMEKGGVLTVEISRNSKDKVEAERQE